MVAIFDFLQLNQSKKKHFFWPPPYQLYFKYKLYVSPNSKQVNWIKTSKYFSQSEDLVAILDIWKAYMKTKMSSPIRGFGGHIGFLICPKSNNNYQFLATCLPSCPHIYYLNEAKLEINFWSTKLDQDHFYNISGKFHEILFRRFGRKVKADKWTNKQQTYKGWSENLHLS